jgi:hypothetical protein
MFAGVGLLPLHPMANFEYFGRPCILGISQQCCISLSVVHRVFQNFEFFVTMVFGPSVKVSCERTVFVSFVMDDKDSRCEQYSYYSF